jgi:predicted transcriptional regulator
MKKGLDSLSVTIVKLLDSSKEPLETKEIEESVGGTRAMVFYRLRELRADGLIKGKQIGSGKGTWIWWSYNFMRGKKNG